MGAAVAVRSTSLRASWSDVSRMRLLISSMCRSGETGRSLLRVCCGSAGVAPSGVVIVATCGVFQSVSRVALRRPSDSWWVVVWPKSHSWAGLWVPAAMDCWGAAIVTEDIW
jgi:hypothetical protein